jgi:hypothetical protein
MTLTTMAGAVVSAAVCASVLVSGQVAAKLDYDTYCKLPTREAKLDAFAGLSAQNKSELLQTHYQRFLDTNRARLSAEQTAVLLEIIAATASLSAPNPRQAPVDLMPLAKLMEKQKSLLSAEDNERLMLARAPCIPKSTGHEALSNVSQLRRVTPYADRTLPRASRVHEGSVSVGDATFLRSRD